MGRAVGNSRKAWKQNDDANGTVFLDFARLRKESILRSDPKMNGVQKGPQFGHKLLGVRPAVARLRNLFPEFGIMNGVQHLYQ
jgi:hypothetical protein